MADISPSPVRTTRLSALRCAATGAVVLAIVFVICWAAAAAGFAGGSHRYISIFTLAPEASLTALAVGLCWSVVFGALAGVLIAVAYNSFAFVDRG
jgi:hypothetical protein